MRSRGRLPEGFLRGCGLSNWELEVAKLYDPDLSSGQTTTITYKIANLLGDQAFNFFSCFISYSHKDQKFARKLHDELQAAGIRCWLDEYELLPGDDIYDEIDRGIWLSDKVLLCCSKDALSSWWVDDELDRVLEKEQRLTKERKDELQGRRVQALIPLNLDGYLLSGKWKSGKARQVLRRLAADFTGWERDDLKFKESFERVVKALRADDDAREPPPDAKL